MWIRSQDKKILTEIHDVEIDSANQIWGSGSFIGEYSTEEKALKVLDEIQRKIECPDSSLISPAESINYYHLSVIGHFYKMPADDEVEI